MLLVIYSSRYGTPAPPRNECMKSLSLPHREGFSGVAVVRLDDPSPSFSPLEDHPCFHLFVCAFHFVYGFSIFHALHAKYLRANFCARDFGERRVADPQA
ncbi:hypothetical protein EJ02DRAFT_455517 [Clathrospora elynae]|uniref:Uncharacterized protein n=1 Tax=Clathrospora elynae TaxID=706981 RepID=A0A6A5SN04_9PLEO|nr:hypothetical protein EJ02DRAFT_455517 [Clathrospora elynae]